MEKEMLAMVTFKEGMFDKFMGWFQSEEGLEIIKTNIQTIKDNETRFVVVSKDSEKTTTKELNKASLKFILSHKNGSLANILAIMADYELNLTKIQSLPVVQTPGKYSFFVDITFKSVENYQKAIKIIQLMAQEFKILGEYKYQKS